MLYLAGEWVPAALGMGAAFLVAGIGVTALGVWVLRGDRINRDYEAQAARVESAVEQPAPVEEPRQQSSAH